MSLALRPLHPTFGVEILRVDVRGVDDAVFKEIVDAFNDHSVLLFRGQTLTDEEQISNGRVTSSCGTTAACCTAAARGTSRSIGESCTGRLWPATGPSPLKIVLVVRSRPRATI
jgi:alpha-ketoglutarate-dependent taurine dioxygenase